MYLGNNRAGKGARPHLLFSRAATSRDEPKDDKLSENTRMPESRPKEPLEKKRVVCLRSGPADRAAEPRGMLPIRARASPTYREPQCAELKAAAATQYKAALRFYSLLPEVTTVVCMRSGSRESAQLRDCQAVVAAFRTLRLPIFLGSPEQELAGICVSCARKPPMSLS